VGALFLHEKQRKRAFLASEERALSGVLIGA
jgi:hypothetical protein